MDFFKKKKNDPNQDSTATEPTEASPFKVKLQDGKVCEKILTIEVAKDRIAEEYRNYYAAIAPKAKVPGFRPGKAPRHVLEMHYEKNANDAVLEQLLSESLPYAIREKGLSPLAAPELHDVQFTREKLSFKAHVEIRPKVKLSRVEGLNAKREKAEVKPDELEKAVENLRERHCRYKAVERPAAMGDFMVMDYVCVIEGKELEKRQDDWVELKASEYLKGFSEQLVGLKAGDAKDIQLNMPENMQNRNMAGKPATFKVTVKEVKEKFLPAVDDELAKQAGDYKDLADLREKLRQDLEKRKVDEKEAEFERALFDELLKHNKIDIPQGLLARRTGNLVEQSKQRFIYQGGTAELFDQEKDKVCKEFEAEAKRQIHLAFLLDEIAGTKQIKVEEADLKQKYNDLAARYRQPAETIEKYYQEHKEALESLLDQVRNEKVIEYIKANAKQS